MVEGMLRQLTESTQRASATVDRALMWIEASNQRIAQMEHEILQAVVH